MLDPLVVTGVSTTVNVFSHGSTMVIVVVPVVTVLVVEPEEVTVVVLQAEQAGLTFKTANKLRGN